MLSLLFFRWFSECLSLVSSKKGLYFPGPIHRVDNMRGIEALNISFMVLCPKTILLSFVFTIIPSLCPSFRIDPQLLQWIENIDGASAPLFAVNAFSFGLALGGFEVTIIPSRVETLPLSSWMCSLISLPDSSPRITRALSLCHLGRYGRSYLPSSSTAQEAHGVGVTRSSAAPGWALL